MILADSHVHSHFSSDSKESPEAIIETCIAKGFQYAFFTDHHDMDFPVNPAEPEMDFQLDFVPYLNFVHNIDNFGYLLFGLMVGKHLLHKIGHFDFGMMC